MPSFKSFGLGAVRNDPRSFRPTRAKHFPTTLRQVTQVLARRNEHARACSYWGLYAIRLRGANAR